MGYSIFDVRRWMLDVERSTVRRSSPTFCPSIRAHLPPRGALFVTIVVLLAVLTPPFSRQLVCLLLLAPASMKQRLRILTVEDEPSLTQLLAIILGGPAAKVV